MRSYPFTPLHPSEMSPQITNKSNYYARKHTQCRAFSLRRIRFSLYEALRDITKCHCRRSEVTFELEGCFSYYQLSTGRPTGHRSIKLT